MVAIGTPDTVRIFQTDQQLGNRFEPIGIPRWNPNKEYSLFISRFVHHLGLRHPSDFKGKEIVEHVCRLSEGLIGETRKLLIQAAAVAITSKREVIDARTLNEVAWVRPSERRRAAR